jgi:hypothetical protein
MLHTKAGISAGQPAPISVMLTAFLVILKASQRRTKIREKQALPLHTPWNFPECLSPQGRTDATPTTSRA